MTLKQMGFEIEASHHECGAGQHEIDFKYADALSTADNIMTFKLVVKIIAKQHNPVSYTHLDVYKRQQQALKRKTRLTPPLIIMRP